MKQALHPVIRDATFKVSLPSRRPAAVAYFQPAFTVVTTWAASPEEFREKCIRMLTSYGWKLLDVERANPVPETGEFSEEVEDMLFGSPSQEERNPLAGSCRKLGVQQKGRPDCSERPF